MEYLLNMIVTEIGKEENLKSLKVNKFKFRKNTRAKYIDGGVYKETKYTLVFMVDVDDWFDRLIRFEVLINTYDFNLKLKIRYAENYLVYSRKDYKVLIKDIFNEIFQFRNKEMDKLKEDKNQNKEVKKKIS
ncbi:hypothetical protein ACSW8S_15530 (plasmid) [Clostridium perfringens]